MECRRWRSHCKVRSIGRSLIIKRRLEETRCACHNTLLLFNNICSQFIYVLLIPIFFILLYWSAHNDAFDDLYFLKSFLFLFMNDIFISLLHSPFVSIVHHSPVRCFLLNLSNKRDSSLNIANQSKQTPQLQC